MLKAHSAQVSPLALQLLPITHFVKQGCTAVQSKGYECSYQIRAGGTGTPKLVTNIFAKIGSDWIMRVN
ncbi:conserved hypothetical protein [Roseibium sp. TrichSKD4]|nr:conserved hypothetical protein [Roseibium sp. TrichSKD4]